MRNVSDKICRGNQNADYMLNIFFENHAVFELMWKNIVLLGKLQMKIWRMCIVCWILHATETHSKYVLLIAFLIQQWLHKCTSLLRYSYIACLV